MARWKRSRDRLVRAAPWVKNTLYNMREMTDSGRLSTPFAEQLRWQAHPENRGLCGQNRNPKSCKVPFLIVETSRKCEEGLRVLREVASSLRDELSAYCFGDVGMTRDMQEIQVAHGKCVGLQTYSEHRDTPSRAHRGARASVQTPAR